MESRPRPEPFPGARAELVQLDRDHPGFRDAEYRERRQEIARLAAEYTGGPPPRVDYTEKEHRVWAQVREHLGELYALHASRPLARLADQLGLDRGRIPQFTELNPRIEAETGFRMLPVAGLIEGRPFLEALGQGVFLATQYVRHPSRPFYTPEPDVIHELIGHAATLLHPRIAAVSRAFGRAAEAAGAEEALRLIRVYWYTLEFGGVEEDGCVKAFGAGLLSSCGEIARFAGQSALQPWDLEQMAQTPFDPTDYQPLVFVGPSFDGVLADLADWLESGSWRVRT